MHGNEQHVPTFVAHISFTNELVASNLIVENHTKVVPQHILETYEHSISTFTKRPAYSFCFIIFSFTNDNSYGTFYCEKQNSAIWMDVQLLVHSYKPRFQMETGTLTNHHKKTRRIRKEMVVAHYTNHNANFWMLTHSLQWVWRYKWHLVSFWVTSQALATSLHNPTNRSWCVNVLTT